MKRERRSQKGDRHQETLKLRYQHRDCLTAAKKNGEEGRTVGGGTRKAKKLKSGEQTRTSLFPEEGVGGVKGVMRGVRTNRKLIGTRTGNVIFEGIGLSTTTI